MSLFVVREADCRGLELETRRARIRVGMFSPTPFPTLFFVGSEAWWKRTRWQVRVWRFAFAIGRRAA